MSWVQFHSSAIILRNVPNIESCGNIVYVDLKLLEILKPEHCFIVCIVGNAPYLRFPIVLDTYGIGIDVT